MLKNEREQFHFPLKPCQLIIELIGQSGEEIIELNKELMIKRTIRRQPGSKPNVV